MVILFLYGKLITKESTPGDYPFNTKFWVPRRSVGKKVARIISTNSVTFNPRGKIHEIKTKGN